MEEPTTNDEGASELVSNTDRVIAGTPFSILRGKQQKKEYKATNLFASDSQTRIPQDIGSLLNEYYVQDFKPKMRASFYSLKSRAESRESR